MRELARARLSRAVCIVSVLIAVVVGCGDSEVVTASYATLAEASAAGAVAEGHLPSGLPPGTRDIRVAQDRASPRRWGLFDFPPSEGEKLRELLEADIPFGGERCNPPRRIEWWPVQLRGTLDEERLAATGLRAYEGSGGDLIFAVHWQQGRAYYWTRDTQ